MDVLHAMAEANHWRIGRFADGAAVDRHRVAIVEEQSVWAEPGHVPRDLHHHRHHAHGAKDAADGHAIPHRLVDAVFARYENVRLPGAAASHGDGSDDHIRAGEQLAPIQRSDDVNRRLFQGHHPFAQPDSHSQSLRVYIHQAHLPLAPIPHQVGHQAAREHRASRADQHNLSPIHSASSMSHKQ